MRPATEQHLQLSNYAEDDTSSKSCGYSQLMDEHISEAIERAITFGEEAIDEHISSDVISNVQSIYLGEDREVLSVSLHNHQRNHLRNITACKHS